MGLNKLNHNYDYPLDIKNAQIETSSSRINNIITNSNISGTGTFSNPLNISASTNFTNDIVISGISNFQEVAEVLVDSTINNANFLFANFLSGGLFYVATAPAANFTIVVTNVPLTNLKTMTISVFVVQGSTGYRPSAFQINGVDQTIRWLGGITPTPTSSAGKIDIFNFSMIRRADTWIVLGSSNLNL